MTMSDVAPAPPVAHPGRTQLPPSVRRRDGRPVPSPPAPRTARGSRRADGGIRWRCSRSSPPAGCPNSCRSATGAWWRRRSRSTEGPPRSWPPTRPRPPTGLKVQLCGDAHLSNFGAFAAPDRRLVFDINDFDETLPGPFEWDVKRLVASFAVAARSGIPGRKRRAIELTVGADLPRGDALFAAMRSLDMWYTRLDVDEIIAGSATRPGPGSCGSSGAATKAESKAGLRAMAKLTEVVDGRPQFINDPPIVVRLEELVGRRSGTVADAGRAAALVPVDALGDDRRALSSASGSPTSPARSSASAASGPGPGWC